MKQKEFLKYSVFSLLAGIFLWNTLPKNLFDDPFSVVVYDRNDGLLGARIATDGQWRFPEPDSIPEDFDVCIRLFEDRFFYQHPGINPLSFLRAASQNLRERRIISGGSTLTMQVIRLSRKGKPRTLYEKLIEMVLSLQLELRFSKEEILRMYASNAPFGGNIVGLEAAAHRYFNRSPFNLSLSETALLAVLPNAPSLIHPGRNREILQKKRDRLLEKMYSKNLIDSFEFRLYREESVPYSPESLTDIAYHLTEKIKLENGPGKYFTGIDPVLQERVKSLLEERKKTLYGTGVFNAACIVVEVETGQVLAYAGNIRNTEHPEYGGDVDIISSPRSTGSILKPLLYTEMMYRGEILPHTLIPDIPTRYGNYSPKNFNRDYKGVIPASEALIRSLNVPSVRMLNMYGTNRFYQDLKTMGFSGLRYPSEHYGLSLILGGAETSLFDLAGIYSSMARVLNHFTEESGSYYRNDWRMPEVIRKNQEEQGIAEEQGIMGAGSVWLCFEALRELKRPDIESGWKNFSSGRKLAWKTGTSFGFRDAWAVGITPGYVVAVWTGNASGEGRPGLTGLSSSAPIMFDVFNVLPETGWFRSPYDGLVKVPVCKVSGYLAGRYCESDTAWIPLAGKSGKTCPYHKRIHLDPSGKFRIFRNCMESAGIIHRNWFVLPPAEEWYYKRNEIDYQDLPPVHASCKGQDNIDQIQVIYPEYGSRIYIPYEYDGKKGRVVFEAAHRNPSSILFWSIDNKYTGETRDFHKMELVIPEGDHRLTLTDGEGNQITLPFTILEKGS